MSPETGLFEPEHVNVFGVPFTFLPHEGREDGPPPPPKPKTAIEPVADRETDFSISWPNVVRVVESMFRGLGAEIHERRGSSVITELNEEVEIVHRPHPRPECGKGLVRRMRRFLERAGVKP